MCLAGVPSQQSAPNREQSQTRNSRLAVFAPPRPDRLFSLIALSWAVKFVPSYKPSRSDLNPRTAPPSRTPGRVTSPAPPHGALLLSLHSRSTLRPRFSPFLPQIQHVLQVSQVVPSHKIDFQTLFRVVCCPALPGSSPVHQPLRRHLSRLGSEHRASLIPFARPRCRQIPEFQRASVPT
jgi:hypothetical protein